jgi:hypothetical protein
LERSGSTPFFGTITWLARSAIVEKVAWYVHGIGLAKVQVNSECSYSDGADCSENYELGLQDYLMPEPADNFLAVRSACSHPFFPLDESASWTYSNGANLFSSGGASGGLSEANASITGYNPQSGQSESVTYLCRERSIGYQSINNDTILEQSGAYLPAPDEFAAGASWSHQYTIGSYSDEKYADYSWECSASGPEEVTAGGQSYEAVRVDCTGSEQVYAHTDILGTAVPGRTATISRSQWFAAGVGLVQAAVTTECTLEEGGDCSEAYEYTLTDFGAFFGGGGGDGGDLFGDLPDVGYSGGLTEP